MLKKLKLQRNLWILRQNIKNVDEEYRILFWSNFGENIKECTVGKIWHWFVS